MNQPAHPHAQPPAAPSASAKKSAWKLWVTLLFIGAVAGTYYFFPPKQATPPPGMMGGGGRGGGKGGRFGGGATPVSTAVAEKGNLSLYLTALGSVNALNTITVKSRADGQLQKIHFTEGQTVKAGDLLAEIDPRQYQVALEQAEGQLARDTALLENAKRDLERYENAREAVTQQQLDQAKAAVAQYTGSVRADQGSVDNYRLQLSYCRVTAPISGTVGLRLVDEGNLVRSSDAGLVVITQEAPIAVVFSIPEDALPQVRKSMVEGQELPIEAFDRAMKVSLAKGKLVAVDNQIDATTGTVRIKAQFENKDRNLFPNQFVNVRMLTGVLTDVLMIPNSAIQLNGQARFVFTVTDDTVSRRTVKVGRVEGEKTVITEGLSAGDVVVTEGIDRLQDGSKVTTRTPVPTAPAGGGRRGGKRGGAGGAPGATGAPAAGAVGGAEGAAPSDEKAKRRPQTP